MLAAGDTFRAAAIGQLKVWADRIGVPIVTGPEGGDAAGVVFVRVGEHLDRVIDLNRQYGEEGKAGLLPGAALILDHRRRADDHRRVHHLGRAEVGPDLRGHETSP